MPWRSAAHHVIVIAAAAAASLISFLASPAGAQTCYAGFGVGFGSSTHWQNSTPPGGYGMSGYDPFVIDHRTGRFRYVPIPYDPEPPGSGYSPYRLNWHSGRWDYVPVPVEHDYRIWRAAAAAATARENDPSRGGTASNYVDGRTIPPSLVPSSVLTMEPSPRGRAQATTAVDRTVPPPPAPTPPPRLQPVKATSPAEPRRQPPPPTTTLARSTPAPAQTTPASASASRGSVAARGLSGTDVGGGWVRIRGVTGRWDYDYDHARWVFVLPSD